MGNLSLSASRIRALIIFILIFFILFTFRLIQIQGIQANEYRNKAANEMESTRAIPAARGEITDINGVDFARSVSAINIVVDQTLITNAGQTANFAAPYLGMTVAQVQSAISGTKRYAMVAKSAKPAVWRDLSIAVERFNASLSKQNFNKRIVGFFAERNFIREYPSGSLVSSLVGFVRQDGIGAAGIESSLNSIISGTDGRYSYARGLGAEIPGSQNEISAAKKGTSIRLTIDRDVQWVAAKAIQEAVANAHASSGTVIVMDPKTGQILAHATAPTFDPNNTKNVSQSLMRNPSVQDVYEPGSTGKIMTLAAALEEKKVTPETVFTVADSIKRGGDTFRDHDRHAVKHLTTSGILAVSSNTGTIQIGEKLSNKTLHDYLVKFGIGQSTGSGLPGESAGLFRNVNDWSGTTAPTVAFGQGYSVTAMQATSIYATIANNGVRVSPTVIAGTTDAAGKFTAAQPRITQRVVSSETARQMRIMLESVVSAGGTAPNAAIPGYRVAGKTGTANRYSTACSCYSGYTASFIGFAPADAPRYVISVTIQDPKGIHYGGLLGGPVFKKVMTFVLQSEHVAPTGTTVIPVALTQADLVHRARESKATQAIPASAKKR